MTLFEECIEALGKNSNILSNEESIKIFDRFEKDFPLVYIADNILSRINWSEIHKKIEIEENILEVKEILEENSINTNREVYILWNEGTLPVLKASLNSVIENIDDVTAVAFDTWICSLDMNFIIEFYHEGECILGFMK